MLTDVAIDTACRVVLQFSAMALGVIACNTIKAIIARLVGSAMAWNKSRLICLKDFFKKLLDCKYMLNYLVSQIILQLFFFYLNLLLEIYLGSMSQYNGAWQILGFGVVAEIEFPRPNYNKMLNWKTRGLIL